MLRGTTSSTTGLSHREPFEAREVADLRGLARPSQGTLRVVLAGALSSLFATGCLVAEAPDYSGSQQTPPHIESSSITPSPFALITVPENSSGQTFTFKVYSEDADDPLLTAFFADYGLVENQMPLDDRTHPPSTLDKPRTISVPVQTFRVADGCHQLTMLVMHESSWNNATDRPELNKLQDVTSVTWWMHVRPDPADPATLFDCPSAEQQPRVD